MTRELFNEIAHRINLLVVPHPIRVAIDGVDAAGKTTLGDELVEPLQTCGRPVIRASIDGFHNPAAIRHQRGAHSPEGYYYDSFNHEAIIKNLLIPLGPGGSREYRARVFDFLKDAKVNATLEVAEPNAVLLFDGVFLTRPELEAYWDFTIFLDASFEKTLERACVRDRSLMGGTAEVIGRYTQRYIPGQRLYLESCRPKESADLIVDNNDPSKSVLIENRQSKSGI